MKPDKKILQKKVCPHNIYYFTKIFIDIITQCVIKYKGSLYFLLISSIKVFKAWRVKCKQACDWLVAYARIKNNILYSCQVSRAR